jgi:hypothetical protein
VYDDGTKVGIGTTGPSHLLTVGSKGSFNTNTIYVAGQLNFEGAYLSNNEGASGGKLELVSFKSVPATGTTGATSSAAWRISHDSYTNPQSLVFSSANPTYSYSTLDYSPKMVITKDGNVAIGLTQTTYRLDVNGTQRIYGRGLTGSTLFTVQGTSGELFTVVDSLTGSLFSVNDISGLPVLESFSDSTTLIGNYLAPALITTKKVTLTANVTASIYSIATASYNSAYFDYNAINTTNARAGSIMAVWNGSAFEFTETTTNDIGNTSGLTFSFGLSSGFANLSALSSVGGWTIKTIIRSI